MGNKCKTCAHARRNEIDRDLVAGVPLRNIAAEFGISHVALGRHLKNGHITKEMQEQFHAEGLIEREEITVQIKDLQRLLHAFLRKANEEGELRDVLMLSKEIRGLIELLGKLLGRFPREPEINILINPVWLSLKQEIFQALKPFPAAEGAVFAAIAGGELSDTQKKMVAGELGFKPTTPAVMEIINREFDREAPDHPELLPSEIYDAKAKNKKDRKIKKPDPVVKGKVCYRCVSAHTFHGKYWAVGQVWDSTAPDGPEPGGENWELYNPSERVSGLLPTKRRG